MIYETKQHECFLCGRDLTGAMVLWNKQNKPAKAIRSRTIFTNDIMVHGKTVLCKCGLAQELEPMTDKTLGEFYSRVDGVSPYREIYPCSKQAVMLHAKNTIKVIQENIPTRIYTTTLLVGAGDLNQVDMYRDCFKGIVSTYDPGLPESNINYQTKPARQFDLIVCNNTLEHVHNPIAFLNGIRAMCHNDTQFVINVPDLFTLAITMSKDQWFSNAHVYHFTWATFIGVLEQAGFIVTNSIDATEEMGNKLYAIVKKGVPKSYKGVGSAGQDVLNFITRSEELFNLQNKINTK